MGADLVSIANSGARAARTALDVTANNIANASSAGYIRRSVGLSELGANSVSSAPTAINLAGVRVSGVVRNADMFRQAEVRRTGSDAARAGAEVTGLENIEAALEQTGVYDSIVGFEGGLQQLLSDPVDGSLRASVVEQGRTLAQTFNVAAKSLDAVGEGLRFEALDGVDAVNRIAGELARVNLRLSRAADASSDQTALLDQRDNLLQELSGHVDLTTSFNADKTVAVIIGGPSGGALVSGGAAGTMAMTTAPGGTVAFTLDGNAVTIGGGAIAGKSLALTELAQDHIKLDAVASSLITTVNNAQAAGVDLAGNSGQPLFAGTGAADMAMVASGGGALATAPASAGAQSRNPANLVALRSALGTADPAGGMDALLFGVSSAVAGRSITRDALASISSSAQVALQAQAGVDLDQEAVNLVRYQQAYQASARIMQVASDIFDSVLAIR